MQPFGMATPDACDCVGAPTTLYKIDLFVYIEESAGLCRHATLH